MRAALARALRNRVSAIGVALTTASALLFLFLIALELLELLNNPYAGIIVFILVPGLFVLGLLLIPFGLWLDHRRRRGQGQGEGESWTAFDPKEPATRRVLTFVIVATVVNLAILSIASYGAVHYSESRAFCGQVCHQVMGPEFVAHQNGLHARVECVSCHVGPGAGAFLSAKVNGTRQLVLVAGGNYRRPVPTPIEGLPAVQSTCEDCHSADRFVGDKIRVFYEHADDEANTQTKTTVRREFPRDFLQTGISSIDALNSVVLGQKLPIFTEAGLPHDALAMQIVAQAQAPGVERFSVVFAALGLPRDIALRYEDAFRRSGARQRVVAFMNYADDPAAERLITPRCALTAAEYLAFDLGLHVLVVLNDVTNYGEALREVSAARGEVPSRKGYPGYMHSDLASIFERAGRVRGGQGSLTQLPIVTMPSGDITHPIPDLTGYVTEGQIVLDRELDRRGVYPPVGVLPSLSRLMNDGIGAGRTRSDHSDIARQLYASCARVARARSLESIIGREELSEAERQYLAFGDAFERRFLTQQLDEARPIDVTLARALEVLALLPDRELTHLPAALLAALRQRSTVVAAAAGSEVA